MNISIREFVYSLLLGARCLDENLPHLKQEQWLWDSYCFSDEGAHYIKLSQRIPAGVVLH
jgi:hypothetical protein